MYHIFFIHSSADGHLGCFPVLAIVYSTTVNIELWFSLDICPLVGLLDHMVAQFLVHTVPHSDWTNSHSHQWYWRVSFSPHPLQYLLFIAFLWWAFWLVKACCFIWKYFLPSCSLSFHFVYSFLNVQTILIKFHLIIFVFIFNSLGGGPKMILL